MATRLPEGFELVEDTSSIPAGFEVVEDSSPGVLSQLGSNVGGTLLGAADIASGVLTAIPLWLRAQGNVVGGADPKAERDRMRQSMADLSPSAMFPDMRNNQSYQYLMKPFELLTEGADAAVETLFE